MQIPTVSASFRQGTGTLQLTKSGTGTLTLPGKNTYTGATTINAGSLIVDGSIASQETIVNAGGFLGGRGTIGGNLSNSGIVGPGDSPGTLTVTNNYTQTATGTLRIQVGGLADNQHDLLAVNGHVTLGGTLQLVRINGFNLQLGNQVSFLTAQNGVSGAFNNVENDFATGTLVQGVITTSANAVVLEGQQGSFTQIPGVTLTGNQSAVAKMLNSAAGDPRAELLLPSWIASLWAICRTTTTSSPQPPSARSMPPPFPSAKFRPLISGDAWPTYAVAAPASVQQGLE